MGFMQNKRVLIVGVASKLSIAYGIAAAMHREGAQLAFTYQNDKLKKRVEEFAASFGSSLVFSCDVANDNEIEQLFVQLGAHWDSLDTLVHSVAYAPADQLEGDFVDVTTREGFRMAHDISSYSLTALSKAAKPLLVNAQGNILTLTYQGSERVLPNYNVMGLAKASLESSVRYLAEAIGSRGMRVNGLSAGAIKTLAASGIKDFGKLLSISANASPLRRNVTIDEVGNVAAFLLSDLASGMTGQITYVDCGVSQSAVAVLENP